MRLKCQCCSHEWDYGGKNEWYTSCPHCRTSLNVREPKSPAADGFDPLKPSRCWLCHAPIESKSVSYAGRTIHRECFEKICKGRERKQNGPV